MSGTTYPTTWRRPPQIVTDRRWRLALQVGIVVYLVLAIGSVDVDWQRVSIGLERGQRFVMGFLQPDFTSRWNDIYRGLIESLTMTLTSTVVGVIISVPIGIGAARNVAPPAIYLTCRAIIAVSRSFQEVIIAIFLVDFVDIVRDTVGEPVILVPSNVDLDDTSGIEEGAAPRIQASMLEPDPLRKSWTG